MEVFVAVVVVLAIAVPFVFTQIWARQQLDLVLTCSSQEALAVITGYFGSTWTVAPGPGTLNYRSKLKMNAPTISISVEGSGLVGCQVSVWTSQYKAVYGGMYHAGLMARKKRGIGKRLERFVAGSAIPESAPIPPKPAV